MSDTTKISYAHSTWSPWIGCSAKRSPGCQNCYGYQWAKRAGKDFSIPVLRKDWKSPLKWNREAFFSLQYRVFPSLCDWLDPQVPVEWLSDFLAVIHDTPNLTWLLLTKRPENWQLRMVSVRNYGLHPSGEYSEKMKSGAIASLWLTGNPPDNVWIGVTCENQEMADERIPLLLKIPARVRWVSCEPLLELIELPLVKLDWVVVGGESGPHRRDCHFTVFQQLALECVHSLVPVWVKQDCATKPGQQGRIRDEFWKLKQLPKA